MRIGKICGLLSPAEYFFPKNKKGSFEAFKV